MEVHHHSHAAHGKKSWKSYFWEFLMLFLAVFCGFLAEYYLEHRIENDREKQYMQSMLEDLKRDTLGINENYALGLSQKLRMDTLIDLINTDSISPDHVRKLYLKSIGTTRVVNVDFEIRTASQLKNAGGMRLIRKKIVVDSILGYWRYAEVCNNISARLDRTGEERFTIQARLFNNKYFINDGRETLSPVTGIKPGAKLISDDPALMAEYSNQTAARRNVLRNYMARMLEARDRAVKLMEVIRNEYHLD
jgi:hypothetical protein